MEEARTQKRNNLIYYLRVHDQNTNRLIGRVVDITTGGIRVYSKEPVRVDRVFQLRMDLPDSIGGDRHISIDARSVWCKRGANPDLYETGFETNNISPEDSEIIKRLIRDSWSKN